MRIKISKDHFERTLCKIEKALNLIGYIPFVSTLSAAVRSFGAVVQILLGLCFSLGFFFLLSLGKSRKIKHLFLLKTSFHHALHGLGNFIRAKIEMLPFLSLVLCLPYDWVFHKRFKYDAEKFPEESVDGEEIEIS